MPGGEPMGRASRRGRPGVAMRECRGCGHVVFPPRPLCPRCGAWNWKPRVAERGVVEAVTLSSQNQLASVRTDDGPTVTVLAPERNLDVGVRVRLESLPGVGQGVGLQVRGLRVDDVDT
jgi:uncharacterized protein